MFGRGNLTPWAFPLACFATENSRKSGSALSRISTEEQKRSELQRLIIENRPYNAPGGLFRQGDMDLLRRCLRVPCRTLQLNVSQALPVFSYEIVAGAVHLGTGNL